MKRSCDLVLASASPRRRQLLERLGLVLRLAPVDLDETPLPGERPGDCVRRLAAAKCDAAVAALAATAGASRIAHGDADAAGDAAGLVTVLGADTMVSLDNQIFGKPGDAAEARAMLARLAGRRHEVTTAYRIWRGPARAPADTVGAAPRAHLEVRVIDRAVTTLVSFRLLQPAEIDAYAACGEWQGKAGGYALQGIAGAFTSELRGSHTNVIGLPLAEVLADLIAAGALADYPAPGFGGAPASAAT
ncbi:MAG TPA: nucleoside triphosphate pyrophosphatase [Polyangia bacterium]|nr:nucleoside triphosphate pyrophosphatase [Polyangia bacterium]